ncbi:hypothetical protein LSAT2_004667 [Lamellibrachia satsuma]|nr:hypothetical protein LSAT2_004667 [Lamellibrachia satsuma]
MLEGVLTRYRLPETKLTDPWTLLTMDQHYNCCKTRQRGCVCLRVHSGNGSSPRVPHACFRFDRSLFRLQTAGRVGSKCLVRVWEDSKRERDDRDLTIGKCHQQPTLAVATGNIRRRRRARRWFNYPTSSDTFTTTAVGERTRTVNVS